MKHFLRLIRINNLLIVLLTLYAMRYGILIPILEFYGYPPILSELQFIFLALSFVFLTGAGYVINDYFDRRADMINRPNSVVLGKKLKRRWGILFHTIFNLIAILCGFAVSYSVGLWWLGFVFVGISIILWGYSVSFKKKTLIGNICVAFLISLVPFIVIIYEYLGVHHTGITITPELSSAIKYSGIIIIGFTIFAFILTLIREIVKDIEDIKGDEIAKCKTLPIVIGKPWTHVIVSALSVISFILIFLGYFAYLKNLEFLQNDNISIWYIIILVLTPILYTAIRIHWCKKKKDYTNLSLLLKFIMLTGVLFTLILQIIITSNTL